MGEDKKRLIHGNLDHETAHVSEERVAREAGRATPLQLMSGESNRTVRMLFNVYEDIRIENKYASLYPGVAENLAAVNRHSVDAFHRRHGSGGPRNFWHLFGCAIIGMARGFDVSWCPGPVLAWLPLVEAEIEEARGIEWADEALELARRTYDKVRAAAEASKHAPELEESDAGEDESGGERVVIHEDKPKDDDGDEGEAGSEAEDNDIHMDLRERAPESKDDKSDKSDSKDAGSSDGDEDGGGEAEAGAAEGDESGTPSTGDESEGDNEDSESHGADEGGAEGDGAGEGDSEGDAAEGSSDGEGNEGSEDSEGGAGADGDPSDTGADKTGGAGGGTGSETTELGDEKHAGLPEGADLNEFDPSEHEAAADDLVDEARKAIESAAVLDLSRGRYIPHPLCQAKDRWMKPHDKKRGDALLLKDYNEALEGVRDQIGAMRSRLLSAVRVMAASRNIGDQEDGRLDSASLHTIRTGNRRVFSRHVKGQTLDAAVSVLVDMSGSMGSRSIGNKSWYAHRAAIALAETFDKLNVPCEVIGFHNNLDRMPRLPESIEGYQGREPFDFMVFKAHDETLSRCRERFAALNGYHDNADGEAVRLVGRRLAARPETRKIMFVLSDGMPAAYRCDFGMLNNDLRDAVKQLTKAGIEVFGVGILTDAVKHFYNESNGSSHIVINKLDQLATEIYKAMRSRLLRRAS